ncbi:MAG: AraC family transcriptional regulator [Burkholderiales bacterium]|nr:AraC family transcriptional regulator [Burkholderiales bacterium]
MNNKVSSQKSSNWDGRRSIVTARILTQVGVEQGADLDALLAQTGISRSMLDDDQAELDTAQEIQLIRNLVQALPHIPTLGLIAGSRHRLHTYGLWGYAVVSSPTWGSAINMASRMMSQTILLTRHRVDRVGDQLIASFESDHIPVDIRPFVVDRDRACAVTLQREIIGQPIPYTEVRMQRPEPAPEQVVAYTDLFGIRPTFGHAQDSGVFKADILNQPLATPVSQTVNHCEQMCRQLIEARYQHTGVVAQVRDRLLRTPGRIPDMEDIAAEMHMTSRTLRRHLTAEGKTFRCLLEEVRSTLAEELMTRANLTHGEIAQRLGYADVTTFIEAFRRWKGMPPSEFRRAQGLPGYTRRSPQWSAVLN